MKRLPAPIASFLHAASYQEDRRGIPLRIRLFVAIARNVTFWAVVMVPFLIIVTTLPPSNPISAIAAITAFGINIIAGFARWDIFLPLGFRLFKRFIEVKE